MTTESIAPQAPVTTPVTPAEPQLFKIKVSGKEIDVPLEELKRSYTLNKGAEEKFEEASKLRKEAEEIRNVFSTKDINSLLKAGWTTEEIESKAAEFIVNQARNKSLTPEQQAQMRREEEYKALKKEKELREKTERERIQNELTQKENQIYQKAFIKDVHDTNSKTWLDLEDPVVLSNVINEITLALQKHEYDMSVPEAVKILEDRYKKRGPTKKQFLKELIKMNKIETDDNDLDAFLEKGIKGVREKSAQAFKKAEAPFVKQRPQTQSQVEESAPVRDAQYYRNIRMGRSHLNKK